MSTAPTAGAATGRRDRTRRALLRAADELFLAQGYAATTVNAIARGAGVSLQTLYLVWGSKRALFEAARDAAASAADLPLSPENWHTRIEDVLSRDSGDDPDARAYLEAFSAEYVRIAGRTAHYWHLARDAAATDPEIARDWASAQAQRRATMSHVAARLPQTGRRPGLTNPEVTDTLWAVAGPETYDLLTQQGEYSLAGYQTWLCSTLVGALCLS
ncbi:MAG: TetR/AcrR family transcriptional regulator [Janthinobacterium lividum]